MFGKELQRRMDGWMEGGMDGWKPLLFVENVQKDSSIHLIRSFSVSFCDYQHFVMFNIWYINVTTQYERLVQTIWCLGPTQNYELLNGSIMRVWSLDAKMLARGIPLLELMFEQHQKNIINTIPRFFFLFHTLFAHYFLATPLQRFCSSSPFHCHVTMMNPSWTLNRQLSLPDSMPAILKVWSLLLGPQVWKHLCRLDHRGHSLSLFHHHLVALRHTRGIKACICCRLKCKRKVQGAPGSTQSAPKSTPIFTGHRAMLVGSIPIFCSYRAKESSRSLYDHF